MPAELFVLPEPGLAEYEELTDMKLRKEDQDWLSAEIGRVVTAENAILVDSFKPHGFRRVAHFLREWGILGSIITAFISLFGITLGAVYVATARVAKQATFESDTTKKLADLVTRLDKIDANLAGFQIGNLSNNVVTETNAREAKKILYDAQIASIKVPAAVVRMAGEKFVTASKSVPAAWDTALSFCELQFIQKYRNGHDSSAEGCNSPYPILR